MSDSRVADILDALYDLLAADPTLAAMVAAGDLQLFDGPPHGDRSGRHMLTVGALPTVDDESESEATADWGSLGVSGADADVDEWVTVPFGISSMEGDSDAMRALRREAIDIFTAAASAIRGSTLSLDVVMWCICSVGTFKQMQTEAGAECLITAAARVRTRI